MWKVSARERKKVSILLNDLGLITRVALPVLFFGVSIIVVVSSPAQLDSSKYDATYVRSVCHQGAHSNTHQGELVCICSTRAQPNYLYHRPRSGQYPWWEWLWTSTCARTRWWSTKKKKDDIGNCNSGMNEGFLTPRAIVYFRRWTFSNGRNESQPT